MQEAIERQIVNQDWITFIIVFQLILLCAIKLFNKKLLIQYSLAFFNTNFIDKSFENKEPELSAFHILIFIFNCICFSLILFSIFYNQKNYITFFWILSGLIIYLGLRILIDVFLELIFELKTESRYFRYTKLNYLYTCGIWLFPFLIIYQFGVKNIYFLICCISALCIIRLFLILLNNKNLIFNNFLYFILYLCTLEIAPLLFVYKTSIL